jgi:hypothetical protein
MTKKYIDAATLFQIRDFMEHGDFYRYEQARIAELIKELLATDDWHLDQLLADRIRYTAKLETEIAKLSHDVNNGLVNLDDVADRLSDMTWGQIEDGPAKQQHLKNELEEL